MTYCVINYYWSIFSLFVAILYCLHNVSNFELEHVNAEVPLAKFAHTDELLSTLHRFSGMFLGIFMY